MPTEERRNRHLNSPDSSSLDLSLDEDQLSVEEDLNDDDDDSTVDDDLHLQHKCLEKILEDLNVSPDSLSSSGRQTLERMVKLVSVVRLYDLNHGSVCEAIVRELIKRDQLDREVVLRKKQVDIINKKLNTIHKKFEILKTNMQTVTQGPISNEMVQKQTQFQYLATKCSKYSTQIAHLRRRLDINTKNCSHGNLSERAEYLAQTRKQISSMKEELDTYIEFPADINMARVKLEEAKRQLELLDHNLSLKIDLSKS